MLLASRISTALRSGKHNDEVRFYAFDALSADGDDLRALPLSLPRPISPGYSTAGRTMTVR